jgi:hypothetical protein
LGIWLRVFGIWNGKKASSKLLDVPFPPVHVQKIAPSLHGKRNIAQPYISVLWEVGILTGCHLHGKCPISYSTKLFSHLQSPITPECLLEDIMIIPVISGSYSPLKT